MTPSTLSYLLAGVLLNAAAQLSLKMGTQRLGTLSPERGDVVAMLLRIATEPAIWLGLGCYAVSVLAWIVALSRTDVSLAYPFLSIGYVVIAVAAWSLFGEVLSPARIAAIALICSGVVLLSRS